MERGYNYFQEQEVPPEGDSLEDYIAFSRQRFSHLEQFQCCRLLTNSDVILPQGLAIET